MNKFSGNVRVRAGAQNAIQLQLIDNGNIQSLVGITELVLILEHKTKQNPQDPITFTLTTDAQLTVIDDENGIIQIVPETTDFVDERIFEYHSLVTDASSNISSFPKGFNYLWEVFK